MCASCLTLAACRRCVQAYGYAKFTSTVFVHVMK